MVSFPSFRAVWTFLSRHRVEFLMLLLALTAAGGFWSWRQPPQPRATWEVVNAGAGCNLSPDGRILYGLSQKEIRTKDGSYTERPVGPVRLWDAATGEERFRILGDGDRLSSARLSPDGRWLAVADRQGGLAVWDVVTGRQHAVLTPLREGNNETAVFRDLRFSPDSRLLAQERANGKDVALWDIATGQSRARLEDARRPLEFSLDGRTLATAADGKAGKLWDVATGQERARLQGFSAPIHSLTFSPDGRLLATDHFDPPRGTFTEVNVWQVASGHLWANLTLTPGSPKNPVYARPLTFGPESRMLVVPSVAGESPLWDVATTPPTSLERLIVCYSEQDASTGETKLCPGAHPVFSPDGRWLAVPGQQPGTLAMLDAAARTPQSVLAVNGNGKPCNSPQFSPDGRTAAVQVFYDEPFYRWQGLLNYRSWRPAGHRVVPAQKLFEVATGLPLGEVPGYWWGGFTPDGQTLFTAVRTEDPSDAPLVVHRWDLPPASGGPTGLYVSVSALVLLLIVAFFWARSRPFLRSRLV